MENFKYQPIMNEIVDVEFRSAVSDCGVVRFAKLVWSNGDKLIVTHEDGVQAMAEIERKKLEGIS